MVLESRQERWGKRVWDEPGGGGAVGIMGRILSSSSKQREVICFMCFVFFFFQFKKQKLLLELDQYAPDVAELIRTPMEMRYIPLKVALL